MMLQAAKALVHRDLQLLWARRGDALQPALFALLTVVLFALALGGDAKSLAPVASAVLWLAVLLAGLLALDSLFRGDAEDGSLEQWMLAPVPLWWLVLVRTLMHWVTTALPVIVAVPLLGELLHLPRAQLPVLMASLLLGTPILSLLGGLGAALTLGLRSGAVLLILLILPLCIPALIFGAGAVSAAEAGISTRGHFSLLGALLIGSGLLAPWATGAALRIATE